MSAKYTADQIAFFRDNIPGHSWRETSDAYEARYGERLTKPQVRHIRKYYGIHPGNIDHPKGNVPANGRRCKIGDEKISSSGLVMVKVCESKYDERAKGNAGGRCWRYKHHIVWEETHGEPVPPGCWLVFANRDRRDFTPSNIVAVPKGALSVINAMHLDYYDVESLQACVSIAQIRMSIKAKRKSLKESARK